MRYLIPILLGTLFVVTACPSVSAGPAVLDSAPIRWATPLDRGPIRVLYLAPRFATWDATALTARLEMELVAVPVWRAQSLGYDPAILEEHTPGFSAEEVAADLADAMKKDYDLFILANLDPAILPNAVLSEIVTRIAQGSGLLLANVSSYGYGPLSVVLDSAESPNPATPGELVTGANLVRRAEYLRLGLVNEGRVADFDFPESPPRQGGLLPDTPDPVLYAPAMVDETLSLIARAALWAAGRDREIRIAGLSDKSPEGPNPEEIPPDLPAEYIASLKDLPMQQPMRPFVVTLNAPAPHKMDLRIQVRERGRPTPAYSVTEPVDKGQETITTFLYLGAGRMTVDAWLETRKGIVDWASREIEIEDWPEIQALRTDKTWLLQNDRIQLNVRVRPVNSRYRSATLYARAEDNLGRVVAETQVPVSSEGGEFALGLELADLVAPLVMVELYALAGEHPNPASLILRVNEPQRLYFPVRLPDGDPKLHLVATAPEVLGGSTFGYLQALARIGVDTLYTPAGDEALLQSAAVGMRLLPEVGRWQGGETRDGIYREPCLSNPGVISTGSTAVSENALHHWAGGTARYGLGNPTFYCTTDEPVCQSESCLTHYRNAGYQRVDPLPIQPDFWVHRAEVLADFLGHMANAVRRIDTQGLSGFRAIGDNAPRNGYGWHELFGSMDWIAADPDPVIFEKIRSYAPAHSFSGIVLGDRVRPESSAAIQVQLWRTAMRGLGSVWLLNAFGATGTPSPTALLDGAGNPTPRALEYAETIAAINEAAGPLLSMATPDPPRIGLLEHPRSAHTSRLDGSGEDRYAQTELAMVELLNQLGYAWRFVRSDDLTEVSLDALFVPHAIATTAEEDARLRTLHANGTQLFADRPLALAEESWQALDAQAEESTRATLLGAVDAAGSYRNLTSRLDILLAASGITKSVALLNESDAKPGLERFHLRLGEAELFGLLAGPEADTQRVAIAFEKGDSVYDILEGTAVLRPHRHPIRLEAGEAALFARIPDAVERIAIVASDTVQAGSRLGFQCMVSTEKGQAGAHWVAAELVPIGGTAASHHRQLLRCRDGVANGYFPLARNVPLGYYVLRIRDLLSGSVAEQDLKIVPAIPLNAVLESANE